MRRTIGIASLLLVVALLVGTNTALAQSSPTSGLRWEGWGVRVGLSADPDQAYGGVHFNLGEFAKNVRFVTSAELGFGDDRRTLQGLAEAHYVFSKVQVWKPYVGGGLGFTHVNFDNDCCDNDGDDSDTDFALMGIGGMETKLKSGSAFFMELKLGFGDDDPDVKVGAGWSFK